MIAAIWRRRRTKSLLRRGAGRRFGERRFGERRGDMLLIRRRGAKTPFPSTKIGTLRVLIVTLCKYFFSDSCDVRV